MNWFRQIFRPRDIFFHDGASLRRFRIETRVQIAIAAAVLVSTLWMLFASFQVVATSESARVQAMQSKVAAMQADYAAMKREAAAHAARIEQRQAFLTAIVAGKADPVELANLLPAERAAQAGSHAFLAPLDRAADKQLAFVDMARNATELRIRETEGLLRRLGVNPKRLRLAQGNLGMGGPFEPVDSKSAVQDADPQFRALFMSWKKLDQLQQSVISVPSLRPVKAMTFTSGYGVRSDPFRGGAAMHAGIDLAGPIGTPIYATADGIVGRAQWANGYGNLVELEHGKGIQTRYGHLSAILVKPGQRIKRGDLIAKMGSTGRSTGSHLHYEVRLDGRAVNPVPFLQSSDYLLAMQRRAEPAQVALGGPEN